MRDYFSQFGEVIECTVMRDGATGRSRGFGFLTFKDPKTVNIVMVKEHYLDGKIVSLAPSPSSTALPQPVFHIHLHRGAEQIDPKRAIPRDEQEKTSKIFVGGVSQETTDHEFREYFARFGRVVDATLMMDKDTGRPRGFGFVTFESDAGVEACLAANLEIHGKPIEVKKAQPRGNMREEEEAAARRGGKFGRKGDRGGGGGGQGMDDGSGGMGGMGGAGAPGGMTPQVMAQYWQRMQQYFAMMQQQMAMNRGAMNMNPAMMQMMQMQQMQQMMAAQQGRGGAAGANPMAAAMGQMNPQQMQQMQQMMMQQQQGQQAGGAPLGGAMSPMGNAGGAGSMSPAPQGGAGGSQHGGSNSGGGGGGGGNGPGYNAFEQQQFEQQKYAEQVQQQQRRPNYRDQQQQAFGGGGGYGGPTSWEGMYDDVPQPMMNQGHMGGGGGGGRGGYHKNRGAYQPHHNQNMTPADPNAAPPPNAPTGPKNAGRPGANYRGGGRGGNRGFHPYSRG